MTHFVEDKRPGILQRRQDTCRLLDHCELEWVRERGSTQARCPPACPSYVGPGIAVLPEEAPPPACVEAGKSSQNLPKCLQCGAVLPAREGAGRPSRFCKGTKCRRRWKPKET